MVRFDPKRGLASVSLDEHIRICITQMLFTRKGERPLSPELGTTLDRFLYRRITPRWTEDLRTMLSRAIEAQEPRVEMREVHVERFPDAPGRIQLRISYRVRESQKVDSLKVVV